MIVAGTDSGMNPLALGIFQGFERTIYVFFLGTGQGANGGPRHSFRYFNDRIEITGTRYGKTGFDNVYAQLLQLAGHFDFLHRIQLTSRHLFAVAESCVKNEKSITHLFTSL